MGTIELELRVLGDRRGRGRSNPVELEPLVLVDLLDEVVMRHLGRACALACALGFAMPATASADAEYIVGLEPGAGAGAIAAAGGEVTRELHIIHAVGARLSRRGAAQLRVHPDVVSVVRNGRMGTSAATPPTPVGSVLDTAFNQSIGTDRLWPVVTGRNVAVAVIDTGIAGS